MALLSSAQRCALKGRAATFKPCADSFTPCARVVSARGRMALVIRAAGDDAFATYKPTVAAFFPGQGAQSVGMAKDLVVEVPAAKDLFDKASEILGYDLLKVRQIVAAVTSSSHATSQHARELCTLSSTLSSLILNHKASARDA